MVTRDELFCSRKKYPLSCTAKTQGNTVMSSHRVSVSTLVQIIEELESEEEEVILFACRDIASNTNLRELLSEVNEGTSHPVILELLYLLKRFDLIKKHFKISKLEVERLLKIHPRTISDYRYLIIELNEAIEEDELKSLMFLLKNELRNGGKLKNQTFLSLIVELEKNQLVMPSDLDLLEKLFQTIHRVDLKKKILKLQETGIIQGGPYINALPATASLHRISSSACSNTIPQIGAASNKGTTPVQDTLSQVGEHDERYLVRKQNMGFCVIIDCVGNDADEKSPGLSLDRIKNTFTGQTCPNLRGKPKLFFIQNYLVCDLEKRQRESAVEVDGPREDAACRQWVQNQSRIPNEADIFWSHCRVDELELQRSSGSTSLYLRSLRDLLNDKRIRKQRDLLNIHTELNHIIYTKQAGYALQLRHTLTKKLFLYPA
ncbi:hypothetical protein GDO81_017164 [Engystomops pustulosus]|uniref:CASP8 and FADD-like apoptosis regulator n=1 Tax=Engystomops pustulosus TaxID=76066 RepID=A0AAV7AFG7_ENGPU|nr:hypothetical protein GDO81_017164 [Engystomops pustulosus]